MQHNKIEIEKVNIHYVEAGAGGPYSSEPRTMIFLHGFPEFWGTWHAQLDYFAKDYRVIAPDLPGYNLSDKPKDLGFYAVPKLIQFIAKFIQGVASGESVILVAHDWGGAIAWPLAAFYPDLVHRLVILNAAHPSTFTREMVENAQQRKKSEYIHQLVAADGNQRLLTNNFQYLKDKIFAGMRKGTLSIAQQQRYLQVWAAPGAVDGMLQYYRAMPQLAPSVGESSEPNSDKKTEQVRPLKQMKVPHIRVDCPTLVLWGEKDQAFVIENLDGIEEYVANVQIVRFPKASHWLQHELPDAVNYEIDCFLRSS